jgi:hypothetical protein
MPPGTRNHTQPEERRLENILNPEGKQVPGWGATDQGKEQEEYVSGMSIGPKRSERNLRLWVIAWNLAGGLGTWFKR